MDNFWFYIISLWFYILSLWGTDLSIIFRLLPWQISQCVFPPLGSVHLYRVQRAIFSGSCPSDCSQIARWSCWLLRAQRRIPWNSEQQDICRSRLRETTIVSLSPGESWVEREDTQEVNSNRDCQAKQSKSKQNQLLWICIFRATLWSASI